MHLNFVTGDTMRAGLAAGDVVEGAAAPGGTVEHNSTSEVVD